MTDEEANDIVSVLSSSTVPSTLPSTVHQEEADSPMGDKEAEANPLEEAGDCLSNRPASSSSRLVNNEMLEENGEDCSAIPPQGVDPQGRQMAGAARAALPKQEKSSEKDVDALTFMQTVVMSFVRGMEYGEQTLPVNDLFVYFPVQLVPALVTAMEQQRFASVEVKGGCGYRPRKQGEEDNPLLVVGVYNKSRYGEMLQRLSTPQQTPRLKSRTQILLQVDQENDRPDTHNQCQWEVSNCRK